MLWCRTTSQDKWRGEVEHTETESGTGSGLKNQVEQKTVKAHLSYVSIVLARFNGAELLRVMNTCPF